MSSNNGLPNTPSPLQYIDEGEAPHQFTIVGGCGAPGEQHGTSRPTPSGLEMINDNDGPPADHPQINESGDIELGVAGTETGPVNVDDYIDFGEDDSQKKKQEPRIEQVYCEEGAPSPFVLHGSEEVIKGAKKVLPRDELVQVDGRSEAEEEPDPVGEQGNAVDESEERSTRASIEVGASLEENPREDNDSQTRTTQGAQEDILIPNAFLVVENDEGNDDVMIVYPARPLLPWYKNKKVKLLFGIVCVLVVVTAASLGVTLSREPETVTEVVTLQGNTSAPTMSNVPTLLPTMKPSLSSVPSLSPSQCSSKVATNKQILDLVVSDPTMTRADIDGQNLVIVTWDDKTNTIVIVFYKKGDTGWSIVHTFVEDVATRSAFCFSDPSISGRIAFVGFCNVNSNGNENSGAVYVYEQNSFDQWQKTDIDLSPEQGFPTDSLFGSWVQVENDFAAVKAEGENAVYVYFRDSISGDWADIEKIQFAFGFIPIGTFRISGDFIVLGNAPGRLKIYKLDRDLGQLSRLEDPPQGENILWFDLSGKYLVYSTDIFDGVHILEWQSSSQSFSLLQTIEATDKYGNEFGRSLVIDGNLLVVGDEKMTHVFERSNTYFEEALAWNEPYERYEIGTSTIAISSSGSVHSFDLEPCTQPLPTQMPSISLAPTTCYWVDINIKYGANPEDVSWDMREAVGSSEELVTLVEHKAGLWDTSYSNSLCLQEGKYMFYISSTYGKGLNGGSYSVKHDEVVIVQGGEFGEFEGTIFELTADGFDPSTVNTGGTTGEIMCGNTFCIIVECWDARCPCTLWPVDDRAQSCSFCAFCEDDDEEVFQYDCSNVNRDILKCNS